MKYIRTNDDIHKLIINKAFIGCSKVPDGYHYQVGDLFGFAETLEMIDNILKNEYYYKIADTVEDLIQIGDIVFYWQQSDDKEHCSLMVYDTDIHVMKYNAITKLLIPVREDYLVDVYGAIWTDKGLIYIAKMNDKGELELL